MAIKIKSFDPDSRALRYTLGFQTTASVGPAYFLVPFESMLHGVEYGMGIKTTSTRLFSLRNITLSRTYLNSASILASGAVGLVNFLGISASDAGTSGAYGPQLISGGSLLKADWTASKGDTAFSLLLSKVEEQE